PDWFSKISALHQAAHDLLGGKILCRDIPRCAAMTGIIAFDSIHGQQDVLHGLEPKQSLTRLNEFAEAGFLGDDGAAGRQVATGSIAKPARGWPNILVTRHGEL